MNSIWRKLSMFLKIGLVLSGKEFSQNRVVYLIPAILWIPLLFLKPYSIPIVLSAKFSLVALVIAFILATVYGLQGFAGETDRKTLDFLLSRPISVILLIATKFLINSGVFLLWVALFSYKLRFDWSLLHLPPVIGGWLFLSLLIILGMGFFSGLIVRGAERLVITVGLSGLLAGGCYLLWNQAFSLMTANFFWFDIPPNIFLLVSTWLPVALVVVSLWTPLVCALWHLRGRIGAVGFKPFRRLALCWLFIILPIELSLIFFAPAVWPNDLGDPKSGDWNPRSGIAIAGSYFKQHYPARTLYIARYGGKARPVYRGSRIHSPRWSPDGRSIAFVDGSWIKVWYRGSRNIQSIVQGDFPIWAKDGKSLAFCRKPDAKGFYDGIYRIDLSTGKVASVYRTRLQLLALGWDSKNELLYLVHEGTANKGQMQIVNLRSRHTFAVDVPTSIDLYMQKPSLVLALDGRVLLGLASEHQTEIYVYIPGSQQLDKYDYFLGRVVDPASQPIISPTALGYLVPRLGGGYLYKGIILPEDEHHHHDGDEDE